jgi:hypothetical protein
MNVRDTYRYFLKNGSNSMLSVSIHMFSTIGNGMEWINGELSYGRPFSDWYNGPYLAKIDDDTDGSLKAKWSLENEVRLLKRKFVTDNMERILDSPVTSNLFEPEISHCYYMLDPREEYARSLNFPNNITKEWAEAVFEFNQHWLTNFRTIHGVGHDGSIDFWPENVKIGYEVVKKHKERAFEIAYGISYAKHMEEMTKLVNEILGVN